jgi:LEA14-like dessication related protein
MSKLTPENEKLLRSYKNITKALTLSPNSREYFEFKKMMTEDELMVLRWLKKEVSHQNHITNKINGTVSTTNRGRKKKEQSDAPATNETE